MRGSITGATAGEPAGCGFSVGVAADVGSTDEGVAAGGGFARDAAEIAGEFDELTATGSAATCVPDSGTGDVAATGGAVSSSASMLTVSVGMRLRCCSTHRAASPLSGLFTL